MGASLSLLVEALGVPVKELVAPKMFSATSDSLAEICSLRDACSFTKA